MAMAPRPQGAAGVNPFGPPNPFAVWSAPPFVSGGGAGPFGGAVRASATRCTISAPPEVSVTTNSDGTAHHLSTLQTATSPFAPSEPSASTPSLVFLTFPEGEQKYFEVSLGALGSAPAGATQGSAVFAPGICFLEKHVRELMQAFLPGWIPKSIGLQSVDGSIIESGNAAGATVVSPPFHVPGAVAGVGVLPSASGVGHDVIFTVNGNAVFTNTLAAEEDVSAARMKMCLGLFGDGVALEVNTGRSAFAFARANGPFAHREFVKAIQAMPRTPSVSDACRRLGIVCTPVAWEDAGRSKGSCFGPNISDMTLCVGGANMPMLRNENFSDVTSDQDMGGFFLVVGNEAGGAKRTIPLSEYLRDIGRYTGDASAPSLLAPARDSKVLTAAQACILPLRDGRVEFNVALFNYQSASEPAVLVIVASSEGTSAQIVLGRENVLRFNKAGGASDYVAERLRDDRAKRGVALDGPMTKEEQKRNALLVFQVPLKVEEKAVKWMTSSGVGGGGSAWGSAGGGGDSSAPSGTPFKGAPAASLPFGGVGGAFMLASASSAFASPAPAAGGFCAAFAGGAGFGSAPSAAAAFGSPASSFASFGGAAAPASASASNPFAFSAASASASAASAAGVSAFAPSAFASAFAPAAAAFSPPPERGIEFAMLSTTDARGKFLGTHGKRLVRDDSMPIRCTMQYYHVTDTAEIGEGVVAALAGQVKELYDKSAPWNRGSLVVGGAAGRVTEQAARSAW